VSRLGVPARWPENPQGKPAPNRPVDVAGEAQVVPALLPALLQWLPALHKFGPAGNEEDVVFRSMRPCSITSFGESHSLTVEAGLPPNEVIYAAVLRFQHPAKRRVVKEDRSQETLGCPKNDHDYGPAVLNSVDGAARFGQVFHAEILSLAHVQPN